MKRNSIWRTVREWALLALVLMPLLYVMFASVVFSLRHPWMTDTERFLYFYRAMTWQTVDYDEARRRH